jgi:hypothetical protein
MKKLLLVVMGLLIASCSKIPEPKVIVEKVSERRVEERYVSCRHRDYCYYKGKYQWSNMCRGKRLAKVQVHIVHFKYHDGTTNDVERSEVVDYLGSCR